MPTHPGSTSVKMISSLSVAPTSSRLTSKSNEVVNEGCKTTNSKSEVPIYATSRNATKRPLRSRPRPLRSRPRPLRSRPRLYRRMSSTPLVDQQLNQATTPLVDQHLDQATQLVLPGDFEEPETLTLYRNSRDGWWKRFKHGLAKFDDPNKDRNESLASLLNLINPNPKEGSFGRWIRLFKIGRYSSFLRRNKEARNLLSQALSQGRLREYLRVLQNSKDLSRLVGTLKDNQGNEFSIPASFLTILGVSSSGATEENREIAMEILQKLKEINPDFVSKKIAMKQLGTEGTQEVDLVTFARSVLNVNEMNPARDALIENLEEWSTSPVAPPKSLGERLKFWK